MPKEKILVVEDEKNIVKLLKYNLEQENYKVLTAQDGETGLALLRKERPDLVVLDLMLPKLDGFQFCKHARQDMRTPIIMLTAKKEESNKILGLELGADDYVTKPFSVHELLARIKAILRRASDAGKPRELLKAGVLDVDLERYEVRIRGKSVTLSSKEFELLKLLLQADGRALSRDDILEKVWGYDRSMEIDTRTVDQHVKRLRDKLGSEAERLLTVKNVGYRFKMD